MLLPYLEANRLEAGCDEVGRGCLCGPVVASAVILAGEYANALINDSKKLSKASREELAVEIKSNALAWAVAEASVLEIDQINILNASNLAMSRAVSQLSIAPEHLLIDGNRFKSNLNIPFDCIVKGDGKYAAIAAASILAKVHRDELMRKLSAEFPGYGWEHNVGYPTREHREAIRTIGTTPHHRKTFQLIPKQLMLDL